MTESIRTKLYELLSSIVRLNLSEAETEDYPYATYDAPVEPIVTKDGVMGYTAEVTIDIYDKDFDTVNTKAAQIISTLATNMRNSTYSSFLLSENPMREEGIWNLELIYRIKQLN